MEKENNTHISTESKSKNFFYGMHIKNQKIGQWVHNHISNQQFLIILSFLIGICTAIAAFLLKSAIHGIQYLLTMHFNIEGANLLYLLYPVIGILLAGLFVKFILKEDISHGVTKILYAISQRKSIIKLHNIWSSIVASSITIGFGGSVGAESPVVLTGSAIGSNLGRYFKLDQKTLMLMVGCGAAGAISGIFQSPMAGVVFTLEVLMIDLTFSSIIPLLIASVTATSISYILMGKTLMFPLNNMTDFDLSRIHWYILLGVVCGFVSLYFTRAMNFIEEKFGSLRTFWKKFAVGGIILSSLIFLMPSLYGEGYDSINALLNSNTDHLFENSLFYDFKDNIYIVLIYIVIIILFKVLASAATNGGGGVGGLFAPSLFIGCLTGYAVALGIQMLGYSVSTQSFSLVGMAGIMSGIMHAPLTGIFLIAELSNGYALFMPLMIVSVVSFVTIFIFEPHSIYSHRLAKKGELMTHNKDRAVLCMLKTSNVIETDLQTIHPDETLGDLVKLISKSNRNIFPVVSEIGDFVGVVSLEEIRNIMFRPELYDRFTMRKLMITSPVRVHIDDSMEIVMKKFQNTNAWNLPVVDGNKYVGYVSKSKIFSAYREVLLEFTDE